MTRPRTARTIPRLIAVAGTVVAILCTPPVAARLFCLDVLHGDDVVPLWTFAAVLAAISWLVVDRAGPRRPWLAALFVPVLGVVGIELAARLWVIHFTDWPQERLAQLARQTYPDLAALQGHPFLHFTGRPDAELLGNRALGGLSPFNRLGFLGPDVPVEKPAGTVRVACLGGSTTASGYPAEMQRWLREQDGGARFECLNFGHGFWSSNHSVANFVLNVLDHDPDYVVFHHGWNDGPVAANGRAFRGDYAHVFKAFDPPRAPDALLIRASTIYRFVRHRIAPAASWVSLDAAILRPVDPALGRDLARAAATFARNARTVVDLAQVRGITPVLVTQPYSTDPDVPFAGSQGQLRAFTERLRELATELDDGVLFVDLDAELSGRADHLFKDAGHMTAQGIRLKAERIGAVILAHRRGG